MCHTVENRNGNGCFVDLTEPTNFLVGYKVFTLKNDKLFTASFHSGEIPYHLTIDETLGLVSLETTTEQPVCFCIPILNHYVPTDAVRTKTYYQEVRAGYHISPFSPDNFVGKIPLRLPLPESEIDLDTATTGIALPVCFKDDWICFYDGSDISCSQFIIPNPEVLAKYNFISLAGRAGVPYEPNLYSTIYKLLAEAYEKGE